MRETFRQLLSFFLLARRPLGLFLCRRAGGWRGLLAFLRVLGRCGRPLPRPLLPQTVLQRGSCPGHRRPGQNHECVSRHADTALAPRLTGRAAGGNVRTVGRNQILRGPFSVPEFPRSHRSLGTFAAGLLLPAVALRRGGGVEGVDVVEHFGGLFGEGAGLRGRF